MPTLVVEGEDDALVYRILAKNLPAQNVEFLEVEGREKLLAIFAERDTLPKRLKIAFIADQDVWVYGEIPKEYQDNRLICTYGYSIENDVYLDGEFEKVFTKEEHLRFRKEVSDYIEWYALALSRHLRNRENGIDRHPNHVLNATERPKHLELRETENYPTELKNRIDNDYQRLLRGKSLFDLHIRNTKPHDSRETMLKSVAVRPGPHLQAIIDQVGGLFRFNRAATARA